MNNAELVNYILSKISFGLLPGGRDRSPPSEADKPSPSSSLTLDYLYRRKRQEWPGYRVSKVANTNSMEPVLDDNCVIVAEVLDAARLAKQPLKAGDIVIYNDLLGRSIIHTLKARTSWFGDPAWILQGDNNKLPDMSKVPEKLIHHRLVEISYAQQPRGGD